MVVIKDFGMPSCCHWDCPLCNEDGGECMLVSHDTKTDTYKERAKDCPLVEIEERKVGKWIIDGHHRRCPKCNEYFCNKDSEGNKIPSSFCPNCGAEMRGSEEL